MTEPPAHRRPLPRDLLSRICATAVPGSTVRRVRRLLGGLEAGMDLVDLDVPDSGRQSVVVRRWGEQQLRRDPGVVARVWQTLGVLERFDISAPRPLWLDEGGGTAGTPVLVMSRVPGRNNLRPRSLERWTCELAEALARIHRVPLDGVDVSSLNQPGVELAHLLREDQPERDAGASIDRPHVRDTVRRQIAVLQAQTPALTHGDFHAGNTLWRRDRLTGVVDWDDAAVDVPGISVGYCRMDLALWIGEHASDLFLGAYERAIGARLAHVALYDLLGAMRVPADPAVWLPGFHEMGFTELTAEQMRGRLRAFTDAALARAQCEA
jgi:aminoglycoside phosphotransferase (APT) family kinase protein